MRSSIVFEVKKRQIIEMGNQMFQILEQQKGLTIAIFIFLLVSILCQLLLSVIYRYLLKETENLSATKNKALKQCKLKFVNCYQLNGKVANIAVFVDKFLSNLRVCHISVGWLSHLAGQLLMLSVLCSGIGVFRAIIAGATLLQIIPYYLITIFSLYLYFAISGLVDLPEKKQMLKTNLMDYLENHQISRLEFNKVKEEEWSKNHISQEDADKSRQQIFVQKKEEISEEFDLQESTQTVQKTTDCVQKQNSIADEELETLLQEFLYTSMP